MGEEVATHAVYFHAWTWENGAQTYCEPDDAAAAGWCVYTRRDTVQGIDMSDEQDFPTRDAAMVEAKRRGEALGLEVREY